MCATGGIAEQKKIWSKNCNMATLKGGILSLAKLNKTIIIVFIC